MENIYLPTLPNLLWLQIQSIFQIFFYAVCAVIIAALLWYFVQVNHRRKKLLQEMHHLEQKAESLSKQMLIKKIQEAQGREFVKFFIEYLERFQSNVHYHGVEELLKQHWFEEQEIQSILAVLYKDQYLSDELGKKMIHYASYA